MSKFSSFEPTKVFFDPNIPQILPHENMYKIQIGSTLFKISGASLSSDGPSYFTNFFTKLEANAIESGSGSEESSGTCQTILFIDRSAEIFELIYQHLQGYYIDIKDEVQYTMLIADSLYYNLPRLRKILRDSEYYYTKIGDVSFKLPKSLFDRDGDRHNYFYITTDTLYVNVERVIISRKLIRPPPHSYSFVPRSPHLFKQIFQLLGGAKQTMDDNLRQSLIKECRYYRLQNLEQQLVKCALLADPVTGRDEIWIKLDDISKKGLLLEHPDEKQADNVDPVNKKRKTEYVFPQPYIKYKRPYIDQQTRHLVVQLDGPDTYMNMGGGCMHMTGKTKTKLELILGNLFEKHTGTSIKRSVKDIDGVSTLILPVIFEEPCPIILDGRRIELAKILMEKLYVQKGLFLIYINCAELVFSPVKLELLNNFGEVRYMEPFL